MCGSVRILHLWGKSNKCVKFHTFTHTHKKKLFFVFYYKYNNTLYIWSSNSKEFSMYHPLLISNSQSFYLFFLLVDENYQLQVLGRKFVKFVINYFFPILKSNAINSFLFICAGGIYINQRIIFRDRWKKQVYSHWLVFIRWMISYRIIEWLFYFNWHLVRWIPM